MSFLSATKKSIDGNILVTEQSGQDLNDYPVELVFDSNSSIWNSVSSDGSDIRFKDTNGNLLSHYIESFNFGGQSAVIYMNAPFLEANETTGFNMLFGDGVNEVSSNPMETFGVWDNGDFFTSVASAGWIIEQSNSNDWSVTYEDYEDSFEGKEVHLASEGGYSRSGFNHAIIENVNFDNITLMTFDATTRWANRANATIRTNGVEAWDEGGSFTNVFPDQTVDLTSVNGTGDFELRQDVITSNYDFHFAVNDLIVRNFVTPEPTAVVI